MWLKDLTGGQLQCMANVGHSSATRTAQGRQAPGEHTHTQRLSGARAWAEAEPLSVAGGCGAGGLQARLVGPRTPTPSGESRFVQKGCDQQKVLFRVQLRHFVKKSLSKLAIRCFPAPSLPSFVSLQPLLPLLLTSSMEIPLSPLPADLLCTSAERHFLKSIPRGSQIGALKKNNSFLS